MADKDDKNPTPAATTAKPGFDPKPVQVGGESLVERLLPHLKQIVIAILVIAGVLTVIFTVRYFKERGRQSETAKVASVIDLAQRQIQAGVEIGTKGPKRPTFGNNKERAQAVVAELDKHAPSATRGAFKASMLVQAGKLDEAIAEYRKHTTGKTLDAVLAREGLGIAIEMKAEQEKDAAVRQKGLEEALATFEAMQPDDKGPRYAYALYHQGRILALLGKNAEAKAQFEKAKQLGGNAGLSSLIDGRLVGLGA